MYYIKGERGSDNISWEIRENTLFISGSGKMPDFDFDKGCEWSGEKFSKVVISEGITTIGDYVFENNENLESVVLPNSIKCIGEGVFEGCGRLEHITIPKNVKEIGAYTFRGCGRLEHITIPKNVTHIGYSAFWEGSEVTIHTPKGSTAHKYAVKNNINVRTINSPKKDNRNKGYER